MTSNQKQNIARLATFVGSVALGGVIGDGISDFLFEDTDIPLAEGDITNIENVYGDSFLSSPSLSEGIETGKINIDNLLQS